jgi:hypothetical protein
VTDGSARRLATAASQLGGDQPPAVQLAGVYAMAGPPHHHPGRHRTLKDGAIVSAGPVLFRNAEFSGGEISFDSSTPRTSLAPVKVES